jgi:hypothetical protein
VGARQPREETRGVPTPQGMNRLGTVLDGASGRAGRHPIPQDRRPAKKPDLEATNSPDPNCVNCLGSFYGAHLSPYLKEESASGGRIMAYDTDAVIELKLDRLRFKRQRYSERMGCRQDVTPAIKMIIGEWYVDELGVPTREITARE